LKEKTSEWFYQKRYFKPFTHRVACVEYFHSLQVDQLFDLLILNIDVKRANSACSLSSKKLLFPTDFVIPTFFGAESALFFRFDTVLNPLFCYPFARVA
jgi:hypothetical protein